jgi:hypothetical protein
MTHFSDPIVVERDLGLYSLALGSWTWSMESLTNHPLNSGAQKLLAHHTWPLHVSVLCYVGPSPSFPLPDGSTSRLWTSSWMSSEGVAPTGGQYGLVITGAVHASRRPLEDLS